MAVQGSRSSSDDTTPDTPPLHIHLADYETSSGPGHPFFGEELRRADRAPDEGQRSIILCIASG